MAYFNAQLGDRPAEPKPAPAPAEPKPEQPYFAAQVGAAAPSAGAPPGEDRPGDRFAECPLCRGALACERGIHRCQGRCGARWLASAGRLIDIAALPLGICGCCEPPLPLARAEAGAICPATGSEYLLLPGGAQPRATAAPLGTCLCCTPPAPLVGQGEALVCSARPDQRYELRAGAPALAKFDKAAGAAETLAAIDAALRRNTARLTVNGLFDLDD